MADSTGIVLAAGGIVVANEIIFAPIQSGKGVDLTTFNWRVVPATVILAITLGGLEKLSRPLGVGLASLTLLAVLMIPVGNAPTPIDNASKIFGKGGGL